RADREAAIHREPPRPGAPRRRAGPSGDQLATEAYGAMLTNLEIQRIRVGSVPVDCVTFAQALDAVTALVERRQGGTVFTPNVDHVVLAAEDDGLRRAYAAVDLALVDGTPLVWASRLLGHRL